MRISSLKNIALWQLPIDEVNEVHENVVSSDLCCFSGVVKHVEGNISRGIWWGEYDEGNMMMGIPRAEYEQGIIYSIVLLLISAIVSTPHSPVTIEAATNFSDSE